MPYLIILVLLIPATITIIRLVNQHKLAKEYRELQCKALKELGFAGWDVIRYHDDAVIVKSRQALEKYDDIKYFKENKDKILMAEAIIRKKEEVAKKLKSGKKYQLKVTFIGPKLYKNVKLVVKFNGKKYKVKTNNMGVAKFKVTKNMVKKYKKGKKVKYTVSYKNDKITKYMKIK